MRPRSPGTSPPNASHGGHSTAGSSSAPQSKRSEPRAPGTQARASGPWLRCLRLDAATVREARVPSRPDPPLSRARPQAAGTETFGVEQPWPGWRSATNQDGCCWGHGRVPGGAASLFRRSRSPGTSGSSRGGGSAFWPPLSSWPSFGPSNPPAEVLTTAINHTAAARRSRPRAHDPTEAVTKGAHTFLSRDRHLSVTTLHPIANGKPSCNRSATAGRNMLSVNISRDLASRHLHAGGKP
jgi:hypothetical protein